MFVAVFLLKNEKRLKKLHTVHACSIRSTQLCMGKCFPIKHAIFTTKHFDVLNCTVYCCHHADEKKHFHCCILFLNGFEAALIFFFMLTFNQLTVCNVKMSLMVTNPQTNHWG